MATPVYYEPADRDLFADPRPVRGVLTADHAASSYGQLVFVRAADGVAMGPGDLAGEKLHYDGNACTPEYAAHEDGECAAANDVACGGCWTPREFVGPRYRRDVCEAMRAAAAAGYNVDTLLSTTEDF